MNLVFKSSFAGSLNWYFENIDETLFFFATEYYAMTNGQWRHYIVPQYT